MKTRSIKIFGLVMLGCLSGPLGANHCSQSHSEGYDYIIVGGGAAGCIEARKLSDNFDKSVLLIEAGSNHITDPVILDPNWQAHGSDLMINPKYSITYPVAVGPLTNTVYSEGRSLGGGGAHHFLFAYRGNPRTYNAWQTVTGNSLWSYSGNILNLMKALETYTPNGTVANYAQRGSDGPISLLQNPPLVTVPGDFFSSLSTQTLTPFVTDYNDPTLGEIGISAVQQFITPLPNSRRSFSGYDYLAEVIDSNGHGLGGRKLTVLTEAQVLKINFNDALRAKSVSYAITESNGLEKIKKADLNKKGVLILAAGSVQTPALLLRSGVGPNAQLNAAGVPVLVDSPHVGQNLQCHYGTSLVMTSPAIPLAFETQILLDGYPYMPNDGVRRVQAISFDGGPVTILAPNVLNPKSRGSVTIVSSNPLTPPIVDVNLFTDGSYSTPGTDAFMQVSFFKIMQTAATASGSVVLFPTPADYASDASLFAAATNLSFLTIQSHIVGTARMGNSIANGVVDGNLNVFGLKNVKIGDNSVQPECVDGNPCFAAYIIALALCQTLGVPVPPAL